MTAFADFQCPKCGKYGLHPYDDKGARPDLTDKITHLWCLYCNHTIQKARRKKK